jgi:hypothetical protein
MSKHRSLIGLIAALAASAAIGPLVVSAHRRARRGGAYTETPEFKAFVAGYLI